MRRAIILVLALAGALLAVPAVAQAHPSLEPRIDALEAAVADLQGRVGFLEGRGVYTKGSTFSLAPGLSTRTQSCNSGDVATGGGWRNDSQSALVRFVFDVPAQPNHSTNNGWTVVVQNDDTINQSIEVHAVCLDQP